jgi:hypothetical protein
MTPVQQPTTPKCPHCSEPLPAIEKFAWGGTGPGDPLITCILCPVCAKPLQFWFFPVAAPAAPEEGAGPRIQIPS